MDIKLQSLYDASDRYVVVQYSLNGGATWTQLGANGQADWYGVSPQISCCGWGNGTLDSWTTVFYDLCELSGESCVKFRVFGNDLYETRFAFDNFQLTDGFSDDLEFVLITPPGSGNCTTPLTATESLGVLFKNNTCRPMTNVPLQIVMTGPNSITVNDTIPGPVPAFSTAHFLLTASTFDMSITGTYNFVGTIFSNTSGTGTSYINDTFPSNNGVTEVRYNNVPINTYPYTADFNTHNDGWVTSPVTYFEQKYFYIDTLPYLNGQQGNGRSWLLNDVNAGSRDAFVESPVFDLSKVTNPRLHMDIKLQSLYDASDRYVVVQYSLNGGTTWTQLGTNGQANWYGVSPQISCCGWGNGTLDSWTPAFYDLCALSGESCVKFRVFGNDLYETKFAFDNFEISAGTGDDLEVLVISPPAGSVCGNAYTSTETVGVIVRNNTCRTLTNIPITFTLGGVGSGVITDTVPGPVPALDVQKRKQVLGLEPYLSE